MYHNPNQAATRLRLRLDSSREPQVFITAGPQITKLFAGGGGGDCYSHGHSIQ